jgi:hypothetical protein
MNRNRYWLALAATAACALALSGCAPKKALTDEEAYQRFVGTWLNTEYAGTPEQVQVQVNKPDYAMEEWLTPEATGPVNQWKAIVKKTWVDEKGKIYCQYIAASSDHPGWLNAWLMRVDKARKVLEFQYGGYGLSEAALKIPDSIDPNKSQEYWIYYRKK